MKKLVTIIVILALIMSFVGNGVVIEVDALSPTYTASSSYASSAFYSKLCNVQLSGNQRSDIVNVALSQLGYYEGYFSGDYDGGNSGTYNNYCEYNYWYHNYVSSGMPIGGDSAPWCATFVSWCARQAGISTSVLANSTAAGHGARYFNINYAAGGAQASDGTGFLGNYYTPKPGDLFYKSDWSHVGIVWYVDGDYFYTIEGNTNNNGSSQGNGVYSLRRKISDCYFGVPNYGSVIERMVDAAYVDFLPIYSYPLTTNRITVYDGQGIAYSNRYIDGATDLCTIWGIYEDGWCYVSYPSSSEADGYFEAYVPVEVFIDTEYEPEVYTTGKAYWVYRRDNLSGAIGTTASGTPCLVTDLHKEAAAFQVIYPIAGTSFFNMGWAATSSYAPQYQITYNANGGTGAPSNQTKYHNTALTLSSTKPTRPGYSFLGWSASSSASSASYQPGDSFTSNANTTLYAVWKKGCESGSHSYSYKTTKEPTISATGILTGTCSRCSATTTVTLPKLDTTNYTYSVTKAATCTASGTGRYTWKTTTYGKFYFDVTVSKTAHSYTNKVTAPTCTAQGYTTHTCSCGDSYKDSYTNALGHSYAYKVSKAPTATATGTLTGTCSRCSATTTVTLPKLTTTDYSYSVTKAATCSATGVGRYTWKTTTYGKFYFDITVSKTAHTYTHKVTAPTCTAQGYTTHTCSCGDSYKDSYKNALGHTYSNGSCTRCNAKDPNYEANTNAPQIVAENKTAAAGDTVSIPIYIKNNPGVAYLKIKVSYGDEFLLTSATNEQLLTGNFTASQTIEANPYTLTWTSASDSTANGCFAVLTFKVADSAKKGQYDIQIVCEEAYDQNYNDVKYSVFAPTITIKDYTYGDANDDGKINGKDAILLAQYLAEWNVSVNPSAADVNADGKVNGKDAIMLAQYLAEWNVVLGK